MENGNVTAIDTADEKHDLEGSNVSSTGIDNEVLTPEEQAAEAELERRLKWKMDLTILPMLSLAYFLSSMARNDLGNAKTAGMTTDLGISAQQYSNISSMFNVGYILFQLPGTILVRKIGPPRQFAGAIMLWGIITICHVWAKDYSTLMGLRFLVGAVEAFLEGGVFYLSFWYTFTELCKRGAIFYSTSALAGSFNGLIAYGVETNLAGLHGWRSWQWLYFVEGILPIGCSFLFLIFLPPTPEQGHFMFSNAERELAIRRSRKAFNPVDPKIRPSLIYKPLVDIRFWLLVAVYSFNHFSVASLSNFLPSIIQGFGLTSVRAQLMSVVVYACAFVGIILFGFIADHTNRRGLPLLGASAFAVFGFILLLTLTGYHGRMAGACILAFGIYATIPVSTTWLTVITAGYTKRGSATAMLNMLAQAFSISGNQAYTDPPLYRRGTGSSLGMTVAHMVAVCCLLYAVKHANDKKDKLRSELSPASLAELKAESLDIVGDAHIDFVYGY